MLRRKWQQKLPYLTDCHQTACEKPFDKMDKKQVMTWSVVVRENEEKVNLYCPQCWDEAKKLLQDFKKRIEEGKNA